MEGGRLLDAPQPFVQRSDGLLVSYKSLRAAGETISLTNSNKDYLGVLRGTGADAQRLALEMDRIGNRLAWEIAA